MTTSDAGYIIDVPYTDNYYGQLAPVMINYVAGLNGFPQRPLESFDYCELGCGYGLSLLLHAAAYPQGRFYGIDLNAEHIAHAQERAARAGLSNLTLLAEGVSEALADREDIPKFDFITMHGLYSWVPTGVREVILRFAEKSLKPGGLLMLSYNCMPGCAIKAPLREMMRCFAAPLSQNSLERAQLGISYLKLMLDSQAPFMEINPSAKKHAEFLIQQDLRYVAHEFLNDEWHPLYFHEADSELRSIGLSYAGSFPLWENIPEADIPAKHAPFFASLTSPAERQQHKDFFRNTTFRNDVYIRAAGAPRSDATDILWATPIALAQPENKTPKMFTVGFADYQFSGIDQAFFDELKTGPRTPAQLAEQTAFAPLSRADLLALCVKWTLIGAVRPVACPVDAAAEQGLSEANIEFLITALSESAAGNVWLASPRFGTAFEMESLQGLALWASTLQDAGGDRVQTLTQMLRRLLPGQSSTTAGERETQKIAEEVFAALDDSCAITNARQLGLI